ncbi:MAG: T9SS type A sorting domain-containing protein [Bacteroidetes bacterium]|nr:T9SS type A sorting domain-containing protein [Bacteroidota bacterium]MBL6944641.1 T9SS type A sorting domain-containing protein [Bacteroidales bacterium]
MNYFFTIKAKTIYLVLGLLVYLTLMTSAQTISIDSTFTTDTEIIPFSTTGKVYGLSLNGSVELFSDNSLVRVILYDTLFNEFLVYEAYPLICLLDDFDINSLCDETCYSDGFVPYSLEIQIINAELTLTTIELTETSSAEAGIMQQQAKETLELSKVNNIRATIQEYHMLWFADTNSISQLPYSQKKKLFGNKYNMLGKDFYIGGIYDPNPNATRTVDNSELIQEWDWRNRHGANDPTKDAFYYHGDTAGKQGWMTKIKSQYERADCQNLCYIYAPLGALEAVANLYFNNKEHRDYDLSTQHVLDCNTFGNGDCSGGFPIDVMKFIRVGIDGKGAYKEQGCYQPEDDAGSCRSNSPPQGPTPYEISFDYYHWISYSNLDTSRITKIKKKLIQYGPMSSTLDKYHGTDQGHVMVMTGFGRIKVGDVYHTTDNGDSVIVHENSPYIGHTYWIFKNSWGTSDVRDGYLYHIDGSTDDTLAHPTPNYFILTQILDLMQDPQEIPSYYDLDNDGYYNWGIGARPDSCPDTEFDSDDSEPRLGPFDDNYFSIPVAPVIEVKHGNNTIPNNSFYSFYNDTLSLGNQEILTFTIYNTGTAQLNLRPNTFNTTITLSEYDTLDFVIDTTGLITTIPQENGNTTFDIMFTLNSPITEPKMATVTIHLNECDMDDYVFTLVYADCDTIANPEFIGHGTTVWSGNIAKFGDVTVQTDATLIVTGNVAFANNADLNINTGGVVIVDGGHLTALCGSWQGVDVWGDITKTQFNSPPEAKLYQGKIKVINGGKISFAVNAIETIKYVDDEPDLTTSGGIVYINNGNIENCTRGVVFYPYKNFYPTINNPQENWSSFYKANFYNDHVYPMSQIYFDRVNGITIKGCYFDNKLPILSQPFYKTMAIYSFNGDFRISEITMSDPDSSIKTTFKGFDYGIYAQGSRPEEYISIRSSVFEDNERGIYLAAIDKPFIVQNTFLVRDKYSKYASSTELIGLYLDGVTTGFTVEENTYYTNMHYNNLETELCNGITVNNSGSNPNELYNNYFKNLTVGISAGGSNRAETGEGLCIKCNDFRSCRTDIYVAPEEDPANSQGIAVIQGVDGNGDPDLAAGNTFSSNNVSNFNNYNCGLIEYTHHYDFGMSSKVRPLPYTINTINLTRDFEADYDKDTSCPSNFGTGIDPIIEKSTLSTENIQIAAYSDTLAMETDGGNTNQLNLDVAVSVPNQAMQLRQQLLDESPFLSDTVMKSAIDKESVLANAMIRDVLIANPQSAKTPDVLQTLDDRYVQMPGYMMAEIMQGQNIVGAKEVIERQLAHHKTKYSKALVKLEKYYINDTINPPASLDSLVALWNNQPHPESKYKLAFHYLYQNDSIGVFNTLDNILVELDLTLHEEDVHQQYEDFFDVLWQTHCNTIGIDSTNIQSLLDISEDYSALPGVYAMNILIHEGELVYNEPVYFPDYFKSVSAFRTWKDTYATEDVIKVFPNPAGTYFIVEHNLTGYEGEFKIVVSDIHGKTVGSYKINSAQNQQVISTLNYPSGIYLVQLYVNGVLKETEKLSISKH